MAAPVRHTPGSAIDVDGQLDAIGRAVLIGHSAGDGARPGQCRAAKRRRKGKLGAGFDRRRLGVGRSGREHRGEQESRRQTSRLATFRAFSWMKSRRGSTTSPISVAEDLVGLHGVVRSPPAAACVCQVDHGRLPGSRVHLAQALVALDVESLAARHQHRVEQGAQPERRSVESSPRMNASRSPAQQAERLENTVQREAAPSFRAASSAPVRRAEPRTRGRPRAQLLASRLDDVLAPGQPFRRLVGFQPPSAQHHLHVDDEALVVRPLPAAERRHRLSQPSQARSADRGRGRSPRSSARRHRAGA